MYFQPSLDASQIAVQEGLRYVSDLKQGYTRKRRGKKFIFLDQHGVQIKDPDIIARIQSIGIPPAYERVWICPSAQGHIQATGFDARGRKQYRYHAKWRTVRDQTKFDHILKFGMALPGIRRVVARDLKKDGLSREKILATVVSLLEKTLIRIGNSEYAEQNDSYGLTTLRRRHVDVAGDTIHFHFTGKSGKSWNLHLRDRRIAAIIKNCSDLPGYELFKYKDTEGQLHEISSCGINDYLRQITGHDFTAKDFRTWSGTVLAAMALCRMTDFTSPTKAKKCIVAAINKVSQQLGNTPAICRKCYVHPTILERFLAGELSNLDQQKVSASLRKTCKGLSENEVKVLAFLKKNEKTKNV